jgi:hypothetical protein
LHWICKAAQFLILWQCHAQPEPISCLVIGITVNLSSDSWSGTATSDPIKRIARKSLPNIFLKKKNLCKKNRLYWFCKILPVCQVKTLENKGVLKKLFEWMNDDNFRFRISFYTHSRIKPGQYLIQSGLNKIILLFVLCSLIFRRIRVYWEKYSQLSNDYANNIRHINDVYFADLKLLKHI